jgi:hypothetical protein
LLTKGLKPVVEEIGLGHIAWHARGMHVVRGLIQATRHWAYRRISIRGKKAPGLL